MKRFRFSLQKLLDLRGQEVEQHRRALALALSEEAEAQRLLSGARTAYAQAMERLHARELLGLTVQEFADARAHLARLGREEEVAAEGAAQASVQVQQARERLMAARQRQRVLEKLKEQRLGQHELDVLREQQKELDEYGARSINDSVAKTDIK